MATIPIINRTRVLMDLLKDGTVASLAAYSSVEQIDVEIGTKYAQAFWDAYPHPQLYEQDGTTPREPTNQELATFYINCLRNYHREVLQSVRARAAADAARDAELATVASEVDSDIGTDEVL